MNKSLFILLVSTLLFSYGKDDIVVPTKVNNYLHLSHTKKKVNPRMDITVENMDYSQFDMLWLGGDLAHLTSQDDATMDHVNSIFNLRSTNTLWSLGNHDHSDLNRVEQFTNRPPYYATTQNKITIVVLDTSDSLSNIIGTQKDFLNGILDTIQESTHLILLHHKLIWMYDNSILEPQIDVISNGISGDCHYCLNPNNFNSEIYPKLVNIKENGIEVLCIGGDIGFRVDKFEYLTSEGIYLLASGIKDDEENSKALLFQHDLINDSLSWEFRLISDL